MATVSGNGYNWISRHFLTKSGTIKVTPKVPWSRHKYFPPFAPVTCFATSSDWLTGLSRPDVTGRLEWFLWFWFDETRRHASKTSLSKLLRPAGGVENGIVIIKEYNAFDLQSVASVSAIRMSCHQSSIACTRSWILFLPKWLLPDGQNSTHFVNLKQ